MRLKWIAVAFAFAGALALAAAPADAAAKKKKHVVVVNRGHTVFVSRDEDGKTRTRIIIQRRSYLEPGTENFPGERTFNDYAFLPGQHASDVQDYGNFGTAQQALPRAFTLPSRNNPWLEY